MKKRNAIIGQSGGPTAAINATLAGVIKGAFASDAVDKIYGMCHGISGVLDDNLTVLNPIAEDKEKLDLLSKTPAAFLGSCRYKLPKDIDDPAYEIIFKRLEEYNIGYFFYIGGNDSMDTVMKLSEYAEKHGKDVICVGVPKTIDNDLPCTDHTPGYGSAAKYIATTIREISADAKVYDFPAVTIVEIMGRNAGWLTGAAALAKGQDLGPDLIYLPERTFSFDKFKNDLKNILDKKPNVLVAVSEGVRTPDGKYVCDQVSSGLSDAFGHRSLSGTANVLKEFVQKEFGIKSRGVELSVCQRCAGHILSKTDIDEALLIGETATRYAMEGKTGILTAAIRTSDSPYTVKCEAVDIRGVANIEKTVPDSYINEAGNDVTDEFINYALPLIYGEVPMEFENGVPKMLVLEK